MMAAASSRGESRFDVRLRRTGSIRQLTLGNWRVTLCAPTLRLSYRRTTLVLCWGRYAAHWWRIERW